MDITRWSTLKSDWFYSLQLKMEKLCTVSKTRLGADDGSDHELLIAKFRRKLKKVGKAIRPFKYNQNQICCDYTVKLHMTTGLFFVLFPFFRPNFVAWHWRPRVIWFQPNLLALWLMHCKLPWVWTVCHFSHAPWSWVSAQIHRALFPLL